MTLQRQLRLAALVYCVPAVFVGACGGKTEDRSSSNAAGGVRATTRIATATGGVVPEGVGGTSDSILRSDVVGGAAAGGVGASDAAGGLVSNETGGSRFDGSSAIGTTGGVQLGVGGSSQSGGGMQSTTSIPTQGCTELCLQQDPECTVATLTSVTGRVLMPNGVVPVSGATVYVPNHVASPWGLTPFTDGVSQGACACDIQGTPLVQTGTTADGSFKLEDVPVGNNIPLVIQIGRWRRVTTIPNTVACTNTALDETQTRLPRTQGESSPFDSLPLMALVTGRDDALECVLRKMGIAISEFSNAGGSGRIRFYRDNGASCTDGDGACTGTTPSYRQLTASQRELDQYDAILFPCDGAAHDEPAADRARVLDVAANTSAYVNKGGRALFTHFSYAWLYNQPPASALPWLSKTDAANADMPMGVITGQIDTSNYDRPYYLADWLTRAFVGALTSNHPPRIKLQQVARNLDNPSDAPICTSALPAQRWIFGDTSAPDSPAREPAVLHTSFETPVGKNPKCGRVHFASFHASPRGSGSAMQFPAECETGFLPEELTMAYLLLDLTNCVETLDDACNTIIYDFPITCEDGCSSDPSVPYTCRTVARTGYTRPCIFSDGLGGINTCYCPP